MAEAVVTLARRIAREGTYKAVAYWVECDDGASRGIVEVVADLTFTGNSGTTYFIVVDGYEGGGEGTDDFDISITCV